jgi:hypothetical protein
MKTVKLSIISAGVVQGLLEYLLQNNMLDEMSKGMIHWKNLAEGAKQEIEDELKKVKK